MKKINSHIQVFGKEDAQTVGGPQPLATAASPWIQWHESLTDPHSQKALLCHSCCLLVSLPHATLGTGFIVDMLLSFPKLMVPPEQRPHPPIQSTSQVLRHDGRSISI